MWNPFKKSKDPIKVCEANKYLAYHFILDILEESSKPGWLPQLDISKYVVDAYFHSITKPDPIDISIWKNMLNNDKTRQFDWDNMHIYKKKIPQGIYGAPRILTFIGLSDIGVIKSSPYLVILLSDEYNFSPLTSTYYEYIKNHIYVLENEGDFGTLYRVSKYGRSKCNDIQFGEDCAERLIECLSKLEVFDLYYYKQKNLKKT